MELLVDLGFHALLQESPCLVLLGLGFLGHTGQEVDLIQTPLGIRIKVMGAINLCGPHMRHHALHI